jgi:hypothetical protein
VAKPKTAKITKPFLHISLFDWRVAATLGFMFGVIVGTAPQYIGMIMLLGAIMGVIKLVDKNRI